MFYDWLKIYQDHDCRLPCIADTHNIVVDTDSGEWVSSTQPPVKHEGSFSTSIQIRCSGNRVYVSGNPSRYGRRDNLFGFRTIDQCVSVYNSILSSYGLPLFTKNSKRSYVRNSSAVQSNKVFHDGTFFRSEHGTKDLQPADGAVITELHITSNLSVGAGNATDFLRALSTLPYRYGVPRLHTNGNTADWLGKSGKASSLIYASAYNKAREIELHTLPKFIRKFGADSPHVEYIKKLIQFCDDSGVVRMEQKVKSAFLRRENLNLYGQIDESILKNLHNEFCQLPAKLKVEAMDLETISERLIAEGICTSTHAANTTAMYAVQWMHGYAFDFKKKQVQTHRARLRQIGVDIAMSCDLTKFSLVRVREARQIEPTVLKVPDWYIEPRAPLRLAA